jgi:hypothetical protein
MVAKPGQPASAAATKPVTTEEAGVPAPASDGEGSPSGAGSPSEAGGVAAEVTGDAAAEAARPWFCLCYDRKLPTGDEPLTACRESEAECHGLERRVAKGGRGIVKGSMLRSCAKITAVRPGEALGTVDDWTASRRPGAWIALGRCLLPEGDAAAAAAAAMVDEDEIEEERQIANGGKILETESLGGITWGMSDKEAIAKLGEPAERDEVWEEPATGDFVQSWTYADGLTLSMKGASLEGPQSVSGISLSAPSTLKTAGGLGIGGSRADAIRLYRELLVSAPDPEAKDEEMVAGSYYGGLFISFEGGSVSSLYLGSNGE